MHQKDPRPLLVVIIPIKGKHGSQNILFILALLQRYKPVSLVASFLEIVSHGN
jgi:hypothetical protein